MNTKEKILSIAFLLLIVVLIELPLIIPAVLQSPNQKRETTEYIKSLEKQIHILREEVDYLKNEANVYKQETDPNYKPVKLQEGSLKNRIGVNIVP